MVLGMITRFEIESPRRQNIITTSHQTNWLFGSFANCQLTTSPIYDLLSNISNLISTVGIQKTRKI